jgi:ABC-type lipoprotein release transport system permease subunit
VQIGQPVVPPMLLVGTFALGVAVTVLAGLLPALSATRVTPMEALKPPTAEAAQRPSRVSLVSGVICILAGIAGLLSGQVSLAGLGCVLFMAGLVLIAPILVRPIASVFGALLAMVFAREGTSTVAQSNLERQPSRAAITASTTMIGLALIVAMAGMMWSISGGFLDVLQRSLGSDYLLMPPSVGLWQSNIGAKRDLADRIRGVPGVGVVSSLRYAASSGNGQAVVALGIEPQAYSRVASLTFQEGDAQAAYAALSDGRAIIVNGIFAAQAKLGMGDTVQLSTPTGVKPYTVVGVAGDYLNAKLSTAYISQANMQTDFRKSEDVFIQFNLAPGADAADVEARVKDILKDYPQFSLVSGRGYIEQNRRLFDAVFVMLVAARAECAGIEDHVAPAGQRVLGQMQGGQAAQRRDDQAQALIQIEVMRGVELFFADKTGHAFAQQGQLIAGQCIEQADLATRAIPCCFIDRGRRGAPQPSEHRSGGGLERAWQQRLPALTCGLVARLGHRRTAGGCCCRSDARGITEVGGIGAIGRAGQFRLLQAGDRGLGGDRRRHEQRGQRDQERHGGSEHRSLQITNEPNAVRLAAS